MLLSIALAGAASPDTAEIGDRTHLWVRGFGALAVNPTGIAYDQAVEIRQPVLRFGGAAFNQTFIGVGARAMITPVNLDLAVRASFQPIDLLPITVEAFWGNYWDSYWGPVPVDRVENQLRPDRAALYDADRDFLLKTYGVSVTPTFQIKFGPIVGFSSWTLTWIRSSPVQSPEPWYFDPFRGMVLAYNDGIIEHTSAMLYETASGEDHTAIFRAGGVARGRWSLQTGDDTQSIGGLVMWRPGKRMWDPTMTLIVTPFLKDPDFPVGSPQVLFVVSSTKLFPI